MKILYLCPDLGIPVLGRRGCSTHVRETCCALRAAGHDVTVLCSNKGHDEGLARGLRIVEVKPRTLRKLGYDVRNLWQNVPLYRRARQIVEREKTEAVYERFSLYSLVGTWLTARYHLPRLVEVNAFLTVEQREKLHFLPLAQWVEKRVARRAPALTVVSQPLMEALVEIGVEERRISIMPMAVDVTHFRPDRLAGETVRRKWRLDGRFVVGYVGSLSGWHGISLLHEMAVQLRREREDSVVFVVGGEGDQLERHRREVAQAGMENHLVFAGSVPYNEVPFYINAMDVTLVPDTNYWTCPTKMFEYQASGVPTVAPKYPAIVKAIDDGEEGFLFEPRNISQAVGHVLRLAADPELRRVMGEKSRRRVVSTQSWQHNVGRIVGIFERIKSGGFSLKPGERREKNGKGERK